MEAKEKAQLIRKTLKERFGYNAKQVSVRTVKCTWSYSLEVIVKDFSVDFDAVKEIAEGFKEIHRDAFGEILGGGNTFVDVSWSDECEKQLVTIAKGILSALEIGDVAEWETVRATKHGDDDFEVYRFALGHSVCGELSYAAWNLVRELGDELLIPGGEVAETTNSQVDFLEMVGAL